VIAHIAITGTLKTLIQDGASYLIKEAGMSFSASVTTETTHLVVGSKPGVQKLARAESMGLRPFGRSHFWRWLAHLEPERYRAWSRGGDQW
jgi:NAD-dependent DNA ligase